MESNPLAPRQRNRRADRQAQQEPPVQQQVQQQAPYPVQPVYPPQQRTYPAQQGYPPQPMYPQQAYQQPAVRQNPPMQQPVQPPMVQYAPRPRALEERTAPRSGWQQPAMREKMEVPQARASRSLTRENARVAQLAQREAEARARKEAEAHKEAEPQPAQSKKLPAWLSTSLTLCFLGVLALIAAYWLMNAYLVTEESKRIAAWEAILSNHHVTEQADGTLRVTWQDEIEKYAAQYNLQPAFVTAIIRNESSFRTNAESSVGARGLMQLMPDTAEWIAGKLDDDSYTFDRMWDGETNIRYGCWYLGYLSRLFHGDAQLVSAAYHAGQTTVTQWLSDPAKSADGVSLDITRLSDGPTKQYIGRVTQTYGIYQSLLYPDEAFDAQDAVPADGSSASAGR